MTDRRAIVWDQLAVFKQRYDSIDSSLVLATETPQSTDQLFGHDVVASVGRVSEVVTTRVTSITRQISVWGRNDTIVERCSIALVREFIQCGIASTVRRVGATREADTGLWVSIIYVEGFEAA
jgi:hypothetical protein